MNDDVKLLKKIDAAASRSKPNQKADVEPRFLRVF